MANHRDSASLMNARIGNAHGMYAKWLAFWAEKLLPRVVPMGRKSLRTAKPEVMGGEITQPRLWATEPEAPWARELAFQSLEALGVGLEVWDDKGRLLFCNRINDRMHDLAYTSDEATRFSCVPPNGDSSWRRFTRTNERRHDALAKNLKPVGNGEAPLLRELTGNRWVTVYKARSAAGFVAVAHVEVTDWVRKDQESKEYVHQLDRDSTTDALTGLASRRHLDQVLATEWHRAARSQTPLSLLIVDTDHLKNYNDCYGHPAGDECLKRVATMLEGCVHRAGELVARYGGEEFVLLLPGVDILEACETAQTCLDRMRQIAVPHAKSPTEPFMTVSIGVACLIPDPAQPASTMIAAASAAMCRAKAGGCARYEISIQPDWEIADDLQLYQPVLMA